MAVSIGPKIGIKGEREFRASLKEIVAEVQSYRAEMEKLTASFSKNDDAITRNKKAQENLNEQISIQEKVLQDNVNIHDKAAQKYSEQVMLVDAYGKAVSQESQMLEEMGQRLEGLRQRYGDNDAVVKGATDTYAKLRKQLDDDTKAYDNLKVEVHRSGQNMQEWKAKVTQAEMELERLRKEIAKAPNYVEEFKRKTEDSKRSLEGFTRQMKTLDAEFKNTQSQYGRFTDAMVKHRDQVEYLTKALEKQKQVVSETRTIREQARQTLQKQTDEYNKLLAKLDEVEKKYGKDSEQAKILNDAIEEQAKLVDEAEKQFDEYNTAVYEATTQQNNLDNELRNNTGLTYFGQALSNIGDKMVEFGDTMTKYITTPLLALSTYAVKAASDFEDGMAKIYTIAIDSTEPMEKMHDELIALSNDTGFDLSDLAEATYQTVSASIDATDAADFMTHSAKLARAGFTSTAKSVDILSTIMNSYGKETYDVTYLSDLLLKTQNDGKLIIDQLASSLGTIIPLAANYHVGIEQIAAAYATMTKQGVPVERATTFMRALFTELEKKGKGVSKVLKDETGKSFAQLMDDGSTLADVLQILYNKMDQDSEEFQLLFKNVRSGQAAASLATGEFSILNDELDRMQNVAGQTEKALAVLETPSLRARRAINRLKNSAEDLGETMMDMAMPAFESLTDKITEMTESFVKLSPKSKEIIVRNGLLAASIGPVIKVGGVLLKYVGGLIAGTSSFIPLIALATGGFVALATAMQVSLEEEKRLREEQYGLTEESKQSIARLDELKQAHSDFKVTMQEETTSVLNSTEYIKQLVTQYDALCTETGEVKEGNETLANVLADELCSALGISREELQLLIDKHGNLSSAIEDTIQKYKEEALASVYKEQLMEATNRLVEHQIVERDLAEQQDIAYQKLRQTSHDLTVAQQAIKDAEEKGIPVTEDMYRAVDEASQNYIVAENALNELNTAVTENKVAMNEAQADIEFYGDKIGEVGEKSKKTADQIESDSKRAENSVGVAVDNSLAKMSEAKRSAYTSGENFARGYANGIEDYAYLSASAASTMGANATRLLKIAQLERSPSKITRQSGRYFGEGYALGMEDTMPMVKKYASQLGNIATDSLSFGSYLPESVGSVVNNTKTISAPISVNLTVNGSVDDSDTFARNIARNLQDLISRERGVFA